MLLADRVVVVRGHDREHAGAGVERERVEELGAAERLRRDGRAPRARVVVDDVVRSQQHVDASPARARPRAGRRPGRPARSTSRAPSSTTPRTNTPCPTKSATKRVARAMVDVVGARPLLDRAVVHDADLVGDRERLVLVVRDEDRGGARSPSGSRAPRPTGARAGRRRGSRTARRAAGAPAFGASARASAIRCCWPPESSCGYALPASESPTSSSMRRVRASRSRALRRSSPNATLRATSRCGKSA